MSSSEKTAKLSALLTEVCERINGTIQDGEVGGVPRKSVTNLMSGAVKLYATISEEGEPGSKVVSVIDDTVSTTEAMVVACALLRAHHLNPFDLALWFSRTAPGHGKEAPGV
jgi:orotate phosphoribosyltransferase